MINVAKRIYWIFCIAIWIGLGIGIFSLIFYRLTPIDSLASDWMFYNVIDPYTKCFTVCSLLLWPAQSTLCILTTVPAIYRTRKRGIVISISSLFVTLAMWFTVLGMWIEWTGR